MLAVIADTHNLSLLEFLSCSMVNPIGRVFDSRIAIDTVVQSKVLSFPEQYSTWVMATRPLADWITSSWQYGTAKGLRCVVRRECHVSDTMSYRVVVYWGDVLVRWGWRGASTECVQASVCQSCVSMWKDVSSHGILSGLMSFRLGISLRSLS